MLDSLRRFWRRLVEGGGLTPEQHAAALRAASLAAAPHAVVIQLIISRSGIGLDLDLRNDLPDALGAYCEKHGVVVESEGYEFNDEGDMTIFIRVSDVGAFLSLALGYLRTTPIVGTVPTSGAEILNLCVIAAETAPATYKVLYAFPGSAGLVPFKSSGRGARCRSAPLRTDGLDATLDTEPIERGPGSVRWSAARQRAQPRPPSRQIVPIRLE